LIARDIITDPIDIVRSYIGKIRVLRERQTQERVRRDRKKKHPSHKNCFV